MAARSNPGAWLVDFTNPVGIVTQALLDEGHHAVGLCNVAIWAQRRLGHYLGVDPDAVSVEHVGLNHLTWIRSARVGASAGDGDGGGGDGGRGEDRLEDLFTRFGPELELESGVPIDVLRLQHALPSYYVHYYYQHDAEVAQQSAPGYRSRADVVAELETKLLEEYRDPALGLEAGGTLVPGRRLLLAGRGPLDGVAARGDRRRAGRRHAQRRRHPGPTRRRRGGDHRHRRRRGAHPLPQRELSPEMLGLVQHAKAYERLAVKAACSGSRDDVVRALLANPLVGQYPLAADLADELLGANRHHLPRFFPS